jgi:hypothetical protein
MKATLAVLAFLLLPSPAGAQSTDLDTVSWISGCWLAKQGSAEVEEVWMPPKGETMIGLSRTVRGGRTTAHEFLTMRLRDGQLVYSAYPSGQEPTDFRATTASDSLLSVRKPDHDFPQRIDYVRRSPGAVSARVFGTVEDAEPAFVLEYRRNACE